MAKKLEVSLPQAPANAISGGRSITEIQKGLGKGLLHDFIFMIVVVSKCQTKQRRRRLASPPPERRR